MKKVFVYFLATALVSSLTAFAVVKLTDKERGDYNESFFIWRDLMSLII